MIHQHKEKKTVEQVQVVVDAIECDLCHTQHPKASVDFQGEVEWEHAGYAGDFSRSIVSFESGFSCPEDRIAKRRSYHICPTCFEQRLEPWLKSNGAEPTVAESDR